MSETASEHPVLEALEKARKAQQVYDMNNDVQLELDLEEENPPITNSKKKRAYTR